ncbi:GGDEF domain-containing protein [Neorhizobium sp. DT-125]|uniref:GGDEF domain-containing protein n=1 Tax=Neorhizobium sp. DT-125 TaxID=3396163 RepID=UPI003F1C8ED0
MPYIQSQHFRETERLTYGWSAPSAAQPGAATPTADPLTRFPTLAEFYRRGQPLVEECLSQRVFCAAAIVDIDHFRRLEAAHDEETISRILKALAAKLDAACTGSRHLLARLGDEEFGLLLVGLDSAATMDFCEEIRLEIAAMRFEAGAADFSITVSIGLAKICGPETFDNYLNAAEQFLFMAKNHGRNQVFSDRTVVLQATG